MLRDFTRQYAAAIVVTVAHAVAHWQVAHAVAHWQQQKPYRKARRHARRRPLWQKTAETQDGRDILHRARVLSLDPQHQHLTDGQLIRLAYWRVTGNP